MKKIVIVDYGMGNLRSVAQAFRAVAPNHDIIISGDPETINQAERLVLPGQGAMPDCMASLNRSGVKTALLKAAQTKPIFGVCVGEQMLFDTSEEGPTSCLGLIAGKVTRFQLDGKTQDDGSRYKVPQMGWNSVKQAPHALWAGIPDNSYFYFVHSFFVVPQAKSTIVGTTNYGTTFCSAVAYNNIFATQFHPEKSADVGLALYRNFISWNP